MTCRTTEQERRLDRVLEKEPVSNGAGDAASVATLARQWRYSVHEIIGAAKGMSGQ